MKRLALILLLLAVPCSADVAVVRHANQASAYANDKAFQTLLSLLDLYGADYFVVNAPRQPAASFPNNIATQSRTGNFTFGQQTRSADVVVHFGFDLGTQTNAGGDSIQTLTRATGATGAWPNKPTVFFGAPVVGGDMYTQTTACSTGVNGYPAPYPTGVNYYSSYLVGTGLPWKTLGAAFNTLHVAPVGSAGIFRAVVRDGPSQASRPFNTTTAPGYNYACTSCDSMGYAATDSIKLWVRYRSSVEPAPLIFCPSSSSDVGLMKMALAMADSASGGRLFETGNNKLPRKRAIAITRAFARGRYDAMNSNNGGGTFCAADSCDSVNVKAGIDSLATLGVPITAFVESDSLLDSGTTLFNGGQFISPQGYSHERAWWDRVPLARFGIQTYSGTSGVKAGAAGFGSGTGASFLLHDPLGFTRARNMIPPGETGLPPTTSIYLVGANGDSSVYGLVRATVERMKYVFPGKFCPAIWPAYNDYSPASDTRATSPKTQDSLAWVLHKAGIRAVIFNPLELTGNTGRSAYNIAGAFVQQPTAGTAPRGFWNQGRYQNVPSSPGATGIIGRLKFIPARSEATTLNWNWAAGHGMKDEFDAGDANSDWYPDWPAFTGVIGTFYYHDFLQRTPIMAFNVQELGGAGQGTTPTRKAWWNIKWAVNQTKAVDALMIPGKRLDVWVYADEVEPQ